MQACNSAWNIELTLSSSSSLSDTMKVDRLNSALVPSNSLVEPLQNTNKKRDKFKKINNR